MIATLINLQNVKLTKFVAELPLNKHGNPMVHPPYFVRLKDRIFLIDPENWRADNAANLITADFRECPAYEVLDVNCEPNYKKEQAA
jgi:hypothetical protein